MDSDSYRRTRCRMCDGHELTQVMTLRPTPPGNRLLRQEELGFERRYPLDLNFCESCHHVQLGHVVDPSVLYQQEYFYVSGIAEEFVAHLRDYAASMMERFRIPKGALVGDIGSNDGTCLRFFQAGGMRVIGIDPATHIAKKATESGIETVPAFFTSAVATDLRDAYGPAAFITSHNTCAHIDHLDDVIRGVHHWLADDGVFVLEVGYFVDVYNNLFFDTIYHEHLDYHTVSPFRSLFARTGMELIRVERIRPQGGSIRVMAQRAGGPFRPDESINELVQLERNLGLDRAETLKHWWDRISQLGAKLRGLLADLKSDGKSIAGYGAPTKAVTLLSQFGIGTESLDFIAEDNPLKHGLYVPVAHVPVTDAGELYSRRPDYVLILAWNFANSIMAKHSRYSKNGGRFVLPMPEPRVVNRSPREGLRRYGR